MQSSPFYPSRGLSTPVSAFKNLPHSRDFQYQRWQHHPGLSTPLSGLQTPHPIPHGKIQHPDSPQSTTSNGVVNGLHNQNRSHNFNNNNNDEIHNRNHMYSQLLHRTHHIQGIKSEKEENPCGGGGWSHGDGSHPQFYTNNNNIHQLWEKAADSEFKLEYMDLDEFLLDNNIDDELVKRTLSEVPSFSSSGSSTQGSPSTFSPLPPCLASPAFRPFPLAESPRGTQGGNSPFCEPPACPDSTASPLSSLCPESPLEPPDSPFIGDDNSTLPGGPDSQSYNSHDSRVAKAKRNRQRKKDNSFNLNLFPNIDTNDTGEIFDPRTRSFSEDELRPQSVSRKNKKQQYVPPELKDDRYWARRRKNNVAAKRSRDARRTKENQIAQRATYLEKENNSLKHRINEMNDDLRRYKQDLDNYKNRLSAYESIE